MATTLAGLQPCGDQSAGQRFDDFAIFSVGNAAAVGGIDDGGAAGVAAAAFENQVVNEEVGGIGVELGA